MNPIQKRWSLLGLFIWILIFWGYTADFFKSKFLHHRGTANSS